MVQGKVKTKVQVLGTRGRNKQKFSHQKKQQQPKKGARYIAPKKAKQIQASKLQKNISKAISARNEDDMISQACAKEPKKLSVASTSGGATKSGGRGAKGKAKK